MTPQAVEQDRSKEDGAEHASSRTCPPREAEQARTSHRAQLLLGAVFGVAFGFLLQTGGSREMGRAILNDPRGTCPGGI